MPLEGQIVFVIVFGVPTYVLFGSFLSWAFGEDEPPKRGMWMILWPLAAVIKAVRMIAERQ